MLQVVHGQHQNIAESWNSEDTKEHESFVRRHFMWFVVQIDIDLTFSTGKKVVQLESLRKLEVDIQVWNSNCSSSLTEVLQTGQAIHRNKLRNESQERKALQRQRPDPFAHWKAHSGPLFRYKPLRERALA